MKEEIFLLDLFSGIGGFAKGLSDSGFKIKKHFFSEIDKHAIACYKYNFKNAEYVGSVTDVQGRELKGIDITTFGFPCQDLSIAGKRLGLKGKRSSLFYEAMRVARESESKIIIWENVAGLLSSNDGNDLKAVLEEMYLSGYIFDFDEQNTSWVLPQNRLRIYCVGYDIKYLWKIINKPNGQEKKLNFLVKILEGYLVNRFQNTLKDPLKQLPIKHHELVLEHVKDQCQKEFNGLNQKNKFLEIMSTLALKDWRKCYQGIQEMQLKTKDINLDLWLKKNLFLVLTDTELGNTETKELEELILSTELLLKNISDENYINLSKCIISILLKPTTKSKTYTYVKMQAIIELFIIQLTRLYQNLWNEALLNLIEREKYIRYAENKNSQNRITEENDNPSFQLCFDGKQSDDTIGHLDGRSRPKVFPFREDDGLFDKKGKPNGGRPQAEISTILKSSGSLKADDTFIIPKKAGTLTAGGNSGGLHSDMTVIPVLTPDRKEKRQNGRRFKEDGEPSHTLTGQDRHGVMIQKKETVGNSQGARIYEPEGISQTLSSGGGGQGAKTGLYDVQTGIRRLTEQECEILQGFPVDWTKYGDYSINSLTNLGIREISMTQRYKMCGNAVTCKVVEEIGKRLLNQ